MCCGGSKRIVRANENYKIITVYSIFESRRFFSLLYSVCSQFFVVVGFIACLLASLSFCFENHDADVLLILFFLLLFLLLQINYAESFFFFSLRKMYLYNLLLVYLFIILTILSLMRC